MIGPIVTPKTARHNLKSIQCWLSQGLVWKVLFDRTFLAASRCIPGPDDSCHMSGQWVSTGSILMQMLSTQTPVLVITVCSLLQILNYGVSVFTSPWPESSWTSVELWSSSRAHSWLAVIFKLHASTLLNYFYDVPKHLDTLWFIEACTYLMIFFFLTSNSQKNDLVKMSRRVKLSSNLFCLLFSLYSAQHIEMNTLCSHSKQSTSCIDLKIVTAGIYHNGIMPKYLTDLLCPSSMFPWMKMALLVILQSQLGIKGSV